jgi:S-adenosylmethionine decarboxylase
MTSNPTERLDANGIVNSAAHDDTGTHLIVELFDVENMIDDVEKIETILAESATAAGGTLLDSTIHKFEPHGVTGLALLAESHISLHTWPEKKYIAADIYTCGSATKPDKALSYLISTFNPQSTTALEVKRGEKRNTKQVINKESLDIDLAGKFGIETSIDLFDCNPETIRSGEKLSEYLIKLCDLIEMKRYGEPFMERFALDVPHIAGYSIAQMIETSLVSGHFSELWNSSYINIFSCKEYDIGKAIEFTKNFFEAKKVKAVINQR